MHWEPTRAAGLARLHDFAPRAGKAYAGTRNYDFGPGRRENVSALSPWLRRRMISEEEVLDVVLDRFALSTAEKFVQEVYWRAYFKGWMERRPAVWEGYKSARDQAFEVMDRNGGLRLAYTEATEGRTGIEGFDDWAKELVETGWLHNHARMWFASIWIFTLRLPWALGADFFLKHLVDADAASNTLSWRWVGGLHTRGKIYLARASNIEKYTEGRFRPRGLATEAPPLEDPPHPGPIPAPQGDGPPMGEALWLLTDDDLNPDSRVDGPKLLMTASETRSPGGQGALSAAFETGAISDCSARLGGVDHVEAADWSPTLVAQAEAAGVREIAVAYPPVGWAADALAAAEPALRSEGISLRRVMRGYDQQAWPHAAKGFFALKKQIPKLVRQPALI